MKSYLFRNPSNSYLEYRLNKRLNKLRSYPVMILFAFIMCFLALDGQDPFSNMGNLSAKFEDINKALLAEKTNSQNKSMIYRGN